MIRTAGREEHPRKLLMPRAAGGSTDLPLRERTREQRDQHRRREAAIRPQEPRSPRDLNPLEVAARRGSSRAGRSDARAIPRDRLPSKELGSPPKHARADVAGPDRDRQRDKWPLLNKEIERIRRAFAFGSRLLAEASDTLFNLAGGVLNRFVATPFMCSIKLATSRFTASRSSRNSSRSESAFIDAVMTAKSPIVARHPLRRRGTTMREVLRWERFGNYSCLALAHARSLERGSASKSVAIAREYCYCLSLAPLERRSSRKLSECLEASIISSRAKRSRWISKPTLRPQDRGVSGRRDRRLGRRPRCLQEASGRAAVGQRHGLHHRAAPRPQPRQHDGGSACGPYLDAGPAGDRRNDDRTRARVCHSAWRLSLGRRQGRVADFEAGGATRRAASFRLPLEFPRSRIWRAHSLRGPFGNRRRRQSWPEVGKGERRSRHRAGHARSRL